MRRDVIRTGVFLLLSALTFAKDQPSAVVEWPSASKPLVRFTFGKFRGFGTYTGQTNYAADVEAQNLWDKTMSDASFSIYLFDKEKVRVGEATASLSNVRPGETVKFQINVYASGTPVSASISARTLPPELRQFAPPKTISLTVNSVPQGASLKLDGKEAGITPKVLQIEVGKHLVQFSKEGFNQ